MRKFERSHPCVLSPDAFKQALQKYAVRHVKGEAVFSLISVRVTNFADLSTKYGATATLVAGDSLLGACLKGLRQQDRVCLPADDFFLFLLPEADQSGVEQACARIIQIIADAKLKHDGNTLKPEGEVLSTHLGDAVCDIDAMLHDVGATLDEHGEIIRRTPEAQQRTIASANLESWLLRYEGFSGRDGGSPRPVVARDCWSTSRVNIRRAIPQAETALRAAWEDVVKRARVLQHIEHPCLNRLIDFHPDETHSSLFVVWRYLEGETLSTALAKKSLPVSSALRWIGELIGALAYLQGLVPPAVPSELTSQCVTILGDDIVIDCSFDAYVFNENPPAEETSRRLLLQTAGLMGEIADATESSQLPAELTQIIDDLKKDKLPPALNTMHKLRSAVRKIIERAETEVKKHA